MKKCWIKQYGRYIAAIAICLSLILLCSCSNEPELVGTWQGDGSLDILAIEAPFEFAEQWTFRTDGIAVAKVGEENIEFKYSATDDTLTFSDGKMSWGVLYKVKSKTLSIVTGNGEAAFTKVR